PSGAPPRVAEAGPVYANRPGHGRGTCAACRPARGARPSRGRREATVEHSLLLVRTSALELELEPLGERQVARPVDGVGLAAHIRLPGIGAGLPPAARVLLAAEGAADLGAGSADVDVGDAAVAARGGEEGLRVLQPVGEERGREAVRRGVLLRDRFLHGLDRNKVEDGTEGLGL